MANGESRISFEVGRLCFMLVLKATYLGGSSIQVGVREAWLQKDNLQLAGAEPHSGPCIKNSTSQRALTTETCCFQSRNPGTVHVWGLCCRFLKFRRRCFCWWVVAVVLLFGCDSCCFFGGCLLSLSIVFVLIVFVVLLKYCYCYSCYCCSGRRRHSIQCLRLIWWSGCWNPNVPHRRGGREGRGSRRFFKVLFPPLVTVASEGYSY